MLLVDGAVGSNDLVAPLVRMGLPAELAQLPSADLAFTGLGDNSVPWDIGIEYKNLHDLVSSLRSDRLQGHQIPKMRKAYDVSYLVIEGELLYDSGGRLVKRVGRRDVRPLQGGMTVGELLKRVQVLYTCGGVHPVWAHTREDALQQIAAIYRIWTDKARDQHNSHIAIYQAPPLVSISETRQTFATLPGVGLKKSGHVEKHFKTIKRAVNASVEEWAEVEGIGITLARKIVRALAD